MTVKELIDYLEFHDQDAKITITLNGVDYTINEIWPDGNISLIETKDEPVSPEYTEDMYEIQS